MDRRPSQDAPDFGTLLRRYRLASGLSQEALAERSGLSTDGIGALERGHRRTPQRETLDLLSAALALEPDQRREFEAAARSSARADFGGAAVIGGPWPERALTRLPSVLTSFVGRDAEIEEIAALVREHRMVTVTGVGGAGKTRIALQLAHQARNSGNDAVAFAEFASLEDASHVIAAIASAVGVQEAPGRELLDTLACFLKGKPLLLIFDNCEHVLTQAAFVAERLLSDCPLLHILATSREAINAAGGHAYRIPSLKLTEAVALFTDRAGAIDQRFALTDENVSSIEQLCQRLGGLPLAIELAAARVNVLPLSVIVAELDNALLLLSRRGQAASPRHQTMRATIDWSYALLSQQEQFVFERLSVFAGACTLQAARMVVSGDVSADDVLDLIGSLVDKSLLITDIDGHEARYHMLEPFRQYGREKLNERGEQERIRSRHALACRASIESVNRTYESGPDLAWRNILTKELDDWRSALQWTLIERRDIPLGLELVAKLELLWYFMPAEGNRWVRLAIDLVENQTPPWLVARLKLTEAGAARCSQDYEMELASAEKATMLLGTTGNKREMARAKAFASEALAQLGRLSESEAMLQSALAFARMAGDRRGIAFHLQHLAGIKAMVGELDAARRYIGESIAAYSELGARGNVAATTCDLATFEFYAGNPMLTARYAAEALEMGRAHDDVIVVVTSLENIAQSLIALERYDEAAGFAREALALACVNQLPVFAAYALRFLGAIAAMRSQITADPELEIRIDAARILGYADDRLKALGAGRYGFEREEYERPIHALRDTLGSDVLAKSMAAGTMLSEDQAVELAQKL